MVTRFENREPPRLEFRRVGVLEPPSGFGALRTASVGPDGPVAIWEPRDDRATWVDQDAEPGFLAPPSRLSARSPAALARYDDGSSQPSQIVELEALPLSFSLVQPLPGSRFIVADMRCSWFPEGPEENAWIIGADGGVQRRGTIGDGIEHLLADAEGTVWAGYFDEGIYGNDGWDQNDSPSPLGAAGIVRWSSDLAKLWQHDQQDDSSWVTDCLALNVDRDRVWACPEPEHPVLEVANGQVRSYPTQGLEGVMGVVVSGRAVALIGDQYYGGVVRRGTLDRGRELEKLSLGLPGGRLVPPGALVCRGSVAHLFVGAEWFQFDLTSA